MLVWYETSDGDLTQTDHKHKNKLEGLGWKFIGKDKPIKKKTEKKKPSKK